MTKVKTLHVRGLHTPRFLVWLLGFYHGRILHTGGLDPENETIASAYIAGQTKRFCKACDIRRAVIRKNLDDDWKTASSLLIEFDELSSKISEIDFVHPLGENHAKTREDAARTKLVKSYETRRTVIRKELSEICNKIHAETSLAQDQIAATAELLLSVFACYGHGLLKQPVYSHNLPCLPSENALYEVIGGRERIWENMNLLLEMEAENE